MTSLLDGTAIATHFPVLQRTIDGQRLVYLDSANTSQKPRCVIDAMADFLAHSYAPINRSAYRLAAEATDAYEGARTKLQRFIKKEYRANWCVCVCVCARPIPQSLFSV